AVFRATFPWVFFFACVLSREVLSLPCLSVVSCLVAFSKMLNYRRLCKIKCPKRSLEFLSLGAPHCGLCRALWAAESTQWRWVCSLSSPWTWNQSEEVNKHNR
uniref:Secreted protein n=1 Tax=Cyanoderma ruficeps TaxID=181631 RepID=A0A8C3QY73_9PASS